MPMINRLITKKLWPAVVNNHTAVDKIRDVSEMLHQLLIVCVLDLGCGLWYCCNRALKILKSIAQWRQLLTNDITRNGVRKTFRTGTPSMNTSVRAADVYQFGVLLTRLENRQTSLLILCLTF
ncbi:hypothetical protein QTP88_007005 [Uroleucon formosanum]